MLKRLHALLGRNGRFDANRKNEHDTGELKVAAAALMVEAACVDGRFDEVEKNAIRSALRRGFRLDADEAEGLIAEGGSAASQSTQLYGFARVIKDRLEPDERIKVMEMLWEVAYADGELHDYEASLARRVAGLLYVSDQDSGVARKKVVDRLAEGDVPDP